MQHSGAHLYDRMVIGRTLCSFVLILALTACTSEATSTIDLTPPADEDPNADSTLLVQAHAEEQCLDDSDLEVGFVRIVDADGAIANTFEAECDGVRLRSDDGEVVGLARIQDN